MEIQKYLKDVAEHFDVTPNIRFNTKLTDAVWSEDEQKWKITTDKGETMEANFIISGAGGLHIPSVPDFKGKEPFLEMINIIILLLFCPREIFLFWHKLPHCPMAEGLRRDWQKRGRHRHGRLSGADHSPDRGQGQDADSVPEDARLGAP